MRNRGHPVLFRLDDREYLLFKRNVQKSKLSQEGFIRVVLSGEVVKECPPLDYFAMMKELHYIGHNLNQIATKANTTGNIDADEYQRQAALLRDAVLRIQKAIELPEKIE